MILQGMCALRSTGNPRWVAGLNADLSLTRCNTILSTLSIRDVIDLADIGRDTGKFEETANKRRHRYG